MHKARDSEQSQLVFQGGLRCGLSMLRATAELETLRESYARMQTLLSRHQGHPPHRVQHFFAQA